MPTSPIRTLLLTLLAAVALPGAASAKDLCVLPVQTCSGANTFGNSGSGVQAALDAAGSQPDSDRVLLGTATYTAPTTNGFRYVHPDSPVQIVGQAAYGTILTSPTDTDATLTVNGGPATTVSDLGLRIPARSANQNLLLAGLDLTGSHAEGVAVTSVPALAGGVGIYLNGGSFDGGNVILPDGGLTYALITSGNGGSVRDTQLHAAGGALLAGNGITLERDRITGAAGSAVEGQGTDIEVEDSLIVVGGPGSAVRASVAGTLSSAVRLDHDTLVGGNSNGNSRGLDAEANGPGTSVSLDVHNTIVRGFGFARYRNVSNGGGSASITTSYSDYDPSSDVIMGAGSGGITPFPGPGDTSANPRFKDEAAHDYNLRPDSPLVDAGDPAGLASFEPVLDVFGGHRLVDGNGDCSARSDIGAAEYQRHDPTARATAAPAAAGEPVAFDGRGSCDPDGDDLTYAWSFDDGGTGEGPTPGHVFTTAGTHTAELTVTDPSALTASTTVQVEVGTAAQSPGDTPPGTGTGPGADTTRPVISRLRAGVTKRRARFSFHLSESATVTLKLQRRVAGHRVGHKCAAGAPRRGHGHRCTALVSAGKRTAGGRAGANSLRAAGGKLKAGRYVVSATAVDAAGNRSVKVVQTGLRVTKR